MNIKKNKPFVTFIVLLVVLGLIAAYVPLLFTQPPQPPVQTPEAGVISSPPAAASLPSNITKPEPSTVAPTSTSAEESPLPDSFSGLEEEGELLDKVFQGIGQ